MKLTIIGAGDAFGSGGNFNTCFHLQANKINLLIDCGATSLVGLKKQHLEPADLDYILISHLHGDHFGGLPFIILDFTRKKRTKALTIIGPPSIEAKTLLLLDVLYPDLIDKIDRNLLEFIEFESNQKQDLHDFKLQTFEVIHSPPSFPNALKLFIDDKIIAFSGDTEWTNNLIPLADEADLLICECNGFKTIGKGHLNYQTIIKNQHLLNAKQIILNHLGDEALENQDFFEIPIAKEGLEIDL
ncbi:MBL fold metallo-hydrolase [Pedobacter sp. SD-b]|uniref:MBL fold metallo-hydrolase n=1 Tax=Pedobacter segetis TaxID=2793069 RepID=A0ABS1BLB3_9SPHI|nr:MBL fold metallo-hydrolase [Pedobacter segetis]MBK0383688.1 MBL fold metallo-hydrolase [Pedobacter segetis]